MHVAFGRVHRKIAQLRTKGVSVKCLALLVVKLIRLVCLVPLWSCRHRKGVVGYPHGQCRLVISARCDQPSCFSEWKLCPTSVT